MHAGGPAGADDVGPFLYRLLMDPAALDSRLRPWARDPLSRVVASRRARYLERQYSEIGGGVSLDRHTREQARGLGRMLTERLVETGATFHAYVATRYGRPTFEEAAERMLADGVTRVVLLPLYPQYSRGTAGSAQAYWHALEGAGAIPPRATTAVREFATHPKYVQALSERIDEALQRFSRDVRERAHVVFTAHGLSANDQARAGDGYCCLVHSTIGAVMAHRGAGDPGRPFHVVFPDRGRSSRWFASCTPSHLDAVAEAGAGAAVVVPISSVSDHLETTFELDIRVREAALHAGIDNFEVTAGLNCHPLFIEALAEVVVAHTTAGERATALESSAAATACPVCSSVVHAREWPGHGLPEPRHAARAA